MHHQRIEGLDRLINLEKLNLSKNAISSIDSLESNPRLVELNLADNNIR